MGSKLSCKRYPAIHKFTANIKGMSTVKGYELMKIYYNCGRYE